MTALTIAVIGVLGVWLLLTAIVQIPSRWRQRVRRYDPAGHLLPGWSFFAPKPVRADFAVWYRSWEAFAPGRDDVPEGDSSPWVELAGIEQRRITDAVLNPGRYTRKSIFMCCYRIVAARRDLSYEPDTATGLPSDAMMVSLPYLLLAEKVSSLSRHAVAVQFRIDVIRYGSGTSRAVTVFRSAVHRILSSEADVLDSTHVAAS